MSRRWQRLINRRRWAHVRFQVLRRDAWKCVKCSRRGRLQVDHVIPLDKGGPKYEIANLQTLCEPCHFAKTAGEIIGMPKSRAAVVREQELVKMYKDMLD